MPEWISFTKVKLPYGGLGNMAPFPIEYEGKTWRTSEALFQALRFPSTGSLREWIRSESSPMGAKMLAKKYQKEYAIVDPRSPTDVENMSKVLALKYAQHAQVRELLSNTAALPIYEDCSARRNESGLFWGAAFDSKTQTWIGQNVLGNLWVKLRDESSNQLSLL